MTSTWGRTSSRRITSTGGLAGLLVRPDRGTCKVQESWRCYDYFVVDVRLSPYVVAVQALGEEDFAPHIPVRLRLAARAKGLIKRVLLAPKALPLQPSMGCARAPAQWPQLPPELSSQQQSDEVWRKLAACTEDEILDSADLAGAAAERCKGRGGQLRWAECPVRPGRLRNRPLGTADTSEWRWLARRLGELQCLLKASAQAGPSQRGLWAQLEAVRGQLRRRAARWSAGGEPQPHDAQTPPSPSSPGQGEWAALVRRAAGRSEGDATDFAFLDQVVAAAWTRAREQELERKWK